MKKIKLAIVTLMLGIATYGGIQTYEHLTMTDAERIMMENVEALANNSRSGKILCYIGGLGQMGAHDLPLCEGHEGFIQNHCGERGGEYVPEVLAICYENPKPAGEED